MSNNMPHPSEIEVMRRMERATRCLSCEGTGIHMRSTPAGRVIVNARPHSCPTCAGTGRMPIAPSTLYGSVASAVAL